MKTITDLSIADIRRNRHARPLVPHLLTLPCPSCRGRGHLVFMGSSHTQGMGPLMNHHQCDVCEARTDLADDYYPRLEYRDGSTTIDVSTGKPV